MSNYIPRGRKKLDRLQQLERDLCRALESSDTSERLERIADRVRSAWIAMYRAACSGLTDAGKRREDFTAYQESIKWWTNKTSNEIVTAYRDKEFRVDRSQTRETSRGLYAQYGTDPFPETREILIRKQGNDGSERDALKFLEDIDHFLDVDMWFVRDVIAVGSAAPEFEALIGKGTFISGDNLRSCVASIRQIRFGVFIAESEGIEVASLHSTDTDCWQLQSKNAAFIEHMVSKYGALHA